MLRNGNLNLIPAIRGGVGGFTPSDLNPVLWLDAGQGASASTWTNQGTGSTDATQGTALNQPTYNATGFGTNSKPYMDFDGTNDFMTLGTEYSKLPEHTAFSVWETDVDNTSQIILGDINAGGQNVATSLVHGMRDDTGNKFDIRFGDQTGGKFSVARETTANIVKSTPYISVTKYVDGDNFETVKRNGVLLPMTIIFSTASSITGTPQIMGVGAWGNNYYFNFNGKIAEILIFDYVLTSEEIASMETYLNDKYAAY